MTRANVFTIAPGAPFLATFVEALLAGKVVPGLSRDSGPLALARATLYVPTRRARRGLVSAFAQAGGGAMLVPRIEALGALDEDDSSLRDDVPARDLIPPAIDPLERQLLLTRLVLGWTHAVKDAVVSVDRNGRIETRGGDALVVGTSPADAFALAGTLGDLIDEFIIEGIDPSKLHGLAEGEHDPYWRITTKFLEIAFAQWPAMLRELGRIDAARRRVSLVEAEVARLATYGSRDPVIVLGSTGTNEATARLMGAICHLPNGAVVLPGLDQLLSDADFAMIASLDTEESEPAFGHPQAALKRLLATLRISREDVKELAPDGMTPRLEFLSEALRPAAATAGWATFRARFGDDVGAALDGVTLLEAADEREEALAIAIRLRGVLETHGATAALVTPDRTIARRVRAELARWRIAVDDSAGESLSVTSAGRLARLAIAALVEVTDSTLLALLAHPAVTLGRDRRDVERLAQMFEIGVCRAAPVSGEAMASRIAAAREAAGSRHSHPQARALSKGDWQAIAALLAQLDASLAPFARIAREASLGEWIAAHRAVIGALAGGILPGDDGETLDELFVQATAPRDTGLRLDAFGYQGLFDRLAATRSLHRPGRVHPRLKILGLLEARLVPADVVVLAGFDETIWPPAARTDPFLNRPMRAALGLTPPERRIGQTVHDAWMAMGAREIVLTRAKKRDRAPTVPSRFLQRIVALAGDAIGACRARGEELAMLARQLDNPAEDAKPLTASPQPRPPLELRPSRLSVTRIETWIRDPYAIYAESILKLKPLGALDDAPGAREQGTAIHAAISQFTRACPVGPLPRDAGDQLRRLADQALAALHDDPAWRAFRWPTIVAGLDYFLAYETTRRPSLARIVDEIKGELSIELEDGTSFVLSAEADRIEIGHDGAVRLVDFKTGQMPSPGQIKADLAPQLTLEAAMYGKGAFPGQPTRPVTDALYIKLGGKAGGKMREVSDGGGSFADLVARHHQKLVALANEFRKPETPYVSRRIPELASRYGDYDHLARVKEWTAGGSDAEEEQP